MVYDFLSRKRVYDCVVLARPSQNKLIWFSDAVLLFVVEWRQNWYLAFTLKLPNKSATGGHKRGDISTSK